MTDNPTVKTPHYTADDIRALREWSEHGLADCKRAFEMAFNPEFGLSDQLQGDIVWAICTLDAGQLAINVRGAENRIRWNLSHGASRAEWWRQTKPELNERYPVRNTAHLTEASPPAP